MKRYVRSRLNPSDSAASIVVRGTASMPERKISTLNAPAKKDSDTMAQVTLLTIGIGDPDTPVVDSRLPTPK